MRFCTTALIAAAAVSTVFAARVRKGMDDVNTAALLTAYAPYEATYDFSTGSTSIWSDLPKLDDVGTMKNLVNADQVDAVKNYVMTMEELPFNLVPEDQVLSNPDYIAMFPPTAFEQKDAVSAAINKTEAKTKFGKFAQAAANVAVELSAREIDPGTKDMNRAQYSARNGAASAGYGYLPSPQGTIVIAKSVSDALKTFGGADGAVHIYVNHNIDKTGFGHFIFPTRSKVETEISVVVTKANGKVVYSNNIEAASASKYLLNTRHNGKAPYVKTKRYQRLRDMSKESFDLAFAKLKEKMPQDFAKYNEK